MATKNNIRSIRFSDELAELIEKLTDRCTRHAEEIAVLLALEDLTGQTFRELFGECEGRDGRV